LGRAITAEEKKKNEDHQVSRKRCLHQRKKGEAQFITSKRDTWEVVEDMEETSPKTKVAIEKGTSRRSIDKSKLRCYECGEHGHFVKECTKWKNKKKDKEQEALLILDDEGPTLL
nr:zinc finger, CCHC-type [Tanacetum cinerariifolium]